MTRRKVTQLAEAQVLPGAEAVVAGPEVGVIEGAETVGRNISSCTTPMLPRKVSPMTILHVH